MVLDKIAQRQNKMKVNNTLQEMHISGRWTKKDEPAKQSGNE